ncbi:MAG: TetR/AcrR family transcriptional regulator [Sphingomonadaceae bacterium]
MSTSPETYHHGALREALIEAGLAALEQGEVSGDISLRALARSVGVSPTAVYRHFPDKRALLATLAAEGLNRLGDAQAKAADVAGGGPAGFSATGRTYVRFALAHPALFRLMFSQGNPEDFEHRQEDRARDLLTRMSRDLAGDPVEAERLAMQAWAIAHGIAMLMLDGRFPADEGLIDRLLDAEVLFVRRPGQGRSRLESP